MLDHKKRAYSEWLVVLSQQGDNDALNSLVKFWQERYFLYALRRLENREAARDVTQEALISICRNLGKLKDPVTYPSWSYRILERRCLDWLRKTIRERNLIEATEELPELAIPENKDAEIGARKLLAKLEPEIRSLLQLYYIDELSISEISMVLNVPRGTVKSRLFYARKSIAGNTR